MNYQERLNELNSKYADNPHDAKEIDRICELALDLCEEMQIIPEINWIPCSERLPNGDLNYHYVVTIECEESKLRYVSREMFTGKWQNIPRARKVIAWMPLPETYKENVDQ